MVLVQPRCGPGLALHGQCPHTWDSGPTCGPTENLLKAAVIPTPYSPNPDIGTPFQDNGHWPVKDSNS